MIAFLKDTIRVGFANIIIIFSGLASSIVTARYLGPEKNGVISALLVYPGLFMTVGSLGIRQSTTYFLGKGIFTEKQIKAAISQIWLLTTIFCLIVCYILMRNFSHSGEKLNYILLALAPLPFTLFNTYNSGIYLGKNEIRTFNKINWIPALLSFVFILIFIVGINLDIAGVLLSAIVGPFLMTILLINRSRFFKGLSSKYDWKIIGSMLSLGVTYAIALFIINLNYRIDIILMDKLSTPFELGVYSKGAGVTQYLWQIPMILSTIVFSRSSTSKDDRQFTLKVAILLRLSFVAVTIISCCLMLFADTVIISMYGLEFFKSIRVLQILLPGVIILTVFKVMNMDLAGKGKPWVSLKAMIPALIVNVILNLKLIPEYGANGAAASSTISYSLAGILFLLFYSKETGVAIKDIVQYKRSDFQPFFVLFKQLIKR